MEKWGGRAKISIAKQSKVSNYSLDDSSLDADQRNSETLII